MEAHSSSQVMTRLNIVYFLSRKGKIEQPHLVRLHHLSTEGVRLRDVKRWLRELRGNDMPESFSWSYKRRYKIGYVWQDLVDDDLVNPVSDNEYVLKGSEISSTSIKDEHFTKSKDQFLQEDSKTTSSKEEHHDQSHNSSETSTYISIKSSSPCFGSKSSTLTEDSIKANKMAKSSSKSTQNERNDEENAPADHKKDRPLHFYSTLLSKSKKRTNKVTTGEKTHSSDNSKISPSKSKSTSNGPSSVLRSLITCGPLGTNDSAVVKINKQNSRSNNNMPNFLNMHWSDLRKVVGGSAETCKGDHQRQLGGSQKIHRTPKWTQPHILACGRESFDGVEDSLKSKSDVRDQTPPSVAYLPVNVPDCSHCGKPFKPREASFTSEIMQRNERHIQNRHSLSGGC